MNRFRFVFYAFASLCLGLIAVASGGVRAAAFTFRLDAELLDQVGVAASIVVALLFLSAALLPPVRSEDR